MAMDRPPIVNLVSYLAHNSLGDHRSDVRIAENGFATSRGVIKSSKVVLA